jgi:predicted NUDIX family phosphoesterase
MLFETDDIYLRQEEEEEQQLQQQQEQRNMVALGLVNNATEWLRQ